MAVCKWFRIGTDFDNLNFDAFVHPIKNGWVY